MKDRSDRSAEGLAPPRLAEKLLSLLLNDVDQEAVLGDFAEEFQWVVTSRGGHTARRWYWIETFISMPALCLLFNQRIMERNMMHKQTYFQEDSKVSLLSLILAVPALLLVFGGVLQSGLGITTVNDALNHELFIFHPLFLLGGLVIAFGLNLLSVVRVRFEEGNLVGIIRVRGKLLNLSVVLGCILVASLIFLYLLFENGPCIFAQQVVC